MGTTRRVALKVDCDTFEGTKTGLPNLLALFTDLKISASFFFTLGPDNSGRAIRRVFTQKGFLKKMIRSNAVSLYGPRTMLYGTLLPSPLIGARLKEVIRSAAAGGHEVGVHGWDHVRWHDRLARMRGSEIEEDYGRAHRVFEDIFGRKANASAAPGWNSTPASLAVQDNYDLLYSSNSRLGPPHFPVAGDTPFKTLEIPTTLPTWDESLAGGHLDRNDLLDFYRRSIRGTEVHTIHTEVEGMGHLAAFEQLLRLWMSERVEFVTLEQYARELMANKDGIPFRTLSRISIPNRGGLVSSSKPLENEPVAFQ